ncbi:MAG: ABC transporter substrate-binding protein [Burkholderiales bacterium]|nr:ABC transporter substrate-binding protein [Burkholderiales bacterium]
MKFDRKTGVHGWKSLLGIAVAAVLGAGPYMTAKAADPVPIRIGWQPDPNAALYIARDTHIFSKMGLDAESIKFLAAPAMFAALQSKSIDVADMGTAPFIIGRTQGIDIQAVMIAVDVSGTNALIVQKTLKVTSGNDLKGLRIGAQRGTTPVYGLSQYLRESGLRLDDVNFVDLTAPNVIPAFRKGEIDATWVWSPWQNMLVNFGGKRITTNKKVGALAPQVWAVRTEWAREHPEALQHFIAAIGMALREVKSNHSLAVKELSTTLNLDEKTANEVLAENDYPTLQEQASKTYALSVLNGYPGSTAGLSLALKNAGNFLRSIGIVKTAVNPDEMINPVPLKKYFEGK